MWKSGLKPTLIFGILHAIGVFLPVLAFAQTFEFPNPLKAQTFLDLVNAVARAVQEVALPFAVVAIIFVGFRFVSASAAGKPEAVAKARALFLWVLVGTAIIVGASILAQAVVNTVKTL